MRRTGSDLGKSKLIAVVTGETGGALAAILSCTVWRTLAAVRSCKALRTLRAVWSTEMRISTLVTTGPTEARVCTLIAIASGKAFGTLLAVGSTKTLSALITTWAGKSQIGAGLGNRQSIAEFAAPTLDAAIGSYTAGVRPPCAHLREDTIWRRGKPW